MDRKKNHYFYIVIGYIGTLFILIAGIRYILIIDDVVGRGLTSKFLTVKERRIINWSLYSVVAIILIIGFIFA